VAGPHDGQPVVERSAPLEGATTAIVVVRLMVALTRPPVARREMKG
jgi:hypothetical protein